jgi:uncharacterized membrane protein
MREPGFDIDEYRAAAQQRQERAEDMELRHEANDIAADNAKTARKALAVSVIAVVISLVAIFVSIVTAIYK